MSTYRVEHARTGAIFDCGLSYRQAENYIASLDPYLQPNLLITEEEQDERVMRQSSYYLDERTFYKDTGIGEQPYWVMWKYHIDALGRWVTTCEKLIYYNQLVWC